MCGIFAYIGLNPIPLEIVFKILSQLEVDQLPVDKSPVGGHGAGIAIITKNKIYFNKIGKENEISPANKLWEIIKNEWSIKEANIIIGHVRRASPKFNHTIKYKECTQPYIAKCTNKYTIISVHNGFLKNYEELKSKFKLKHKFESEKITLIDSEVYPHLMEELIINYGDNENTTNKLLELTIGNNTTAILAIKDKNISLHVIHKGATRGLYVWRNENTLLLCSRKHIIEENIGKQIEKLNLKIKINPKEKGEAKLYWKVPSKILNIHQIT